MNMRRNRAFQVPVKDLSLFRTGWTREGPAEIVDGDLVRQEELSPTVSGEDGGWIACSVGLSWS
jgi:hypothetical protein